MSVKAEELLDQGRFRLVLSVPFNELIDFVLGYLKRKTGLMVFFWAANLFFLLAALSFRIQLAGHFPIKSILLHSVLGFLVFPILIIPVHELIHVITFLFTGAKRIRVGMDLSQYIFYVTAHRHVVTPGKFRLVALTPFIVISLTMLALILTMPGLWKWSLSSFLFVHTTMCAGDFALLNFFSINRSKKILTYDDAEEKVTYFYEEL
jgi:hypothetical protein